MTTAVALDPRDDDGGDASGPPDGGIAAAHATPPPPQGALAPFARALRPDRLAVVVLLVFGVWTYLGQSLRADIPDHGDWWTDMALITATHRIEEYGFWTTRLALPLDDGAALGTDTVLYANWPTAPFQLQALAYRLGLQPRHVRALSVAETLAAGYALVCLVRLLAGGRAARFTLLFFLTAAPVRLLADSFGYVPVDLLGRFAAFLAVAVTAGIDPERDRRAWWTGLGLSTAAIVANALLLGFESFPAACIFAAGYPLLRLRPGRAGVRRAAAAALGVPLAALALVVPGRLLTIALLPGPFGEDLAQVRHSAEVRFERGAFGVSFTEEWSLRLQSYVPVLLVIGAVAVAVASFEALRRRRALPLATGGLVLLAEGAWIVTAQQHSQRHVHTIALLLLSLTLPAGWLAGRVAGVLAEQVPRGRALVALASVAGFTALLTDPGLAPYGNVVTRVDWRGEQDEAARIRAVLAPDAVVAVSASMVDRGPVLVFLLEHPSLKLPHRDLSRLAAERPVVYVYRHAVPDDAARAALAVGGRVLVRTEQYEALTFPAGTAFPPALDPDG